MRLKAVNCGRGIAADLSFLLAKLSVRSLTPTGRASYSDMTGTNYHAAVSFQIFALGRTHYFILQALSLYIVLRISQICLSFASTRLTIISDLYWQRNQPIARPSHCIGVTSASFQASKTAMGLVTLSSLAFAGLVLLGGITVVVLPVPVLLVAIA